MNIFKKMDDLCNMLFWFILKLSLAVILDIFILFGILYVYIYEISDYGQVIKVRQMYRNIVVQTGQTQDALPLVIVDSPIDNAGTDGQKIVVYMGFIKAHNWDEIALVLGHEIAHYNLGHLNLFIPVPQNNNILAMGTNGYDAVLEANADKMGAIYMMKAGYDVCKGREIFKYWKAKQGNDLGQVHPDFDYRYAELNINCD